MAEWFMRLLVVLGLVGGLMALGLVTLWLVVRISRPKATGAAGDETRRGDLPDVAPLTDKQAHEIGAQIRMLNPSSQADGRSDESA